MNNSRDIALSQRIAKYTHNEISLQSKLNQVHCKYTRCKSSISPPNTTRLSTFALGLCETKYFVFLRLIVRFSLRYNFSFIAHFCYSRFFISTAISENAGNWNHELWCPCWPKAVQCRTEAFVSTMLYDSLAAGTNAFSVCVAPATLSLKVPSLSSCHWLPRKHSVCTLIKRKVPC